MNRYDCGVISPPRHGVRWLSRLLRRASLGTMLVLAALSAHAHLASRLGVVPVYAANHFRLTAPKGPYAVGLQIVKQHDNTRAFRDALGIETSSRPLQTLVWFPAREVSGRSMTVADYGDLIANETTFDQRHLPSRHEAWLRAMAPALGDQLLAHKGALPALGRFPVVIYAPSFSAPSWENADLCEYLASYGYTVLASPDMGASSREMTADIAGIAAQERDIAFLITYAKTLQDADTTEVAVIGYSWGGISNLFAGSHDGRIRALVALDGEMRYSPGLVKDAGIDPGTLRLPLLFFTQGDISLEEQEHWFTDRHASEARNVLNAWTSGDLMTVELLGFVHFEFSSMNQRNEDRWKAYDADHKADYTRADGLVGYALTCEYTRHFLDAYLKHDQGGLTYLERSPRENGAPSHFLKATLRRHHP